MLNESYCDNAMNTESSLTYYHTNGRKLLHSLVGLSFGHFPKQKKNIKAITLAKFKFKGHKVL